MAILEKKIEIKNNFLLLLLNSYLANIDLILKTVRFWATLNTAC